MSHMLDTGQNAHHKHQDGIGNLVIGIGAALDGKCPPDHFYKTEFFGKAAQMHQAALPVRFFSEKVV